jgi:hypothetical protein
VATDRVVSFTPDCEICGNGRSVRRPPIGSCRPIFWLKVHCGQIPEFIFEIVLGDPACSKRLRPTSARRAFIIEDV